ncbi:zinc finger BED domain-containing 1-like [Brachionus plicatilis]|uniref:Zinc finger BED domain-containing 1-like n=1 Tax=Brachionus plicatilis TaxID=10195 RepID=A0A3M7Q891_BRAPC|nr:zinc finger BED domain-containing 1-like [Brachionus plicatilis]
MLCLRFSEILNKLVSIVTDNASNMKNLKRFLLDSFRNSESTQVKKIKKKNNEVEEENDNNECILYETELNLMESFSNLAEKCRKIESMFHQSTVACEILEEKQKNKYISMAKCYIRKLVEQFPIELKVKLNLANSLNCNKSTESNNQIDLTLYSNSEEDRFQFFDFTSTNLEPAKKIEPVEFWKQNKENFPILYQIFIRVFCTPATSVPSEQLFSYAGYSVWDRRNKISPENLNFIRNTTYSNIGSSLIKNLKELKHQKLGLHFNVSQGNIVKILH